jgi:hypothetical protein
MYTRGQARQAREERMRAMQPQAQPAGEEASQEKKSKD